jgi:hypothetical protein
MAIRIFNVQASDFNNFANGGKPGLDETLKFVDEKGETVMELISDADGTKTLSVDGEVVKFFPNIEDDGTNIILTLPETDPEIAGALWNDDGIVTVSAGAAPPPEEEE